MNKIDEKKKGRAWPVGIFIVYIAFVGMFVAVYVIGSSQNNDLVAKNYYEQELKYQQRIDEMENVKKSGALPVVEYNKDRHTVRVKIPGIFLTSDLRGKIAFSRADDAALDFNAPLKMNPDTVQIIPVKNRKKGRWVCALSWESAAKKYYWKTILVF